MESFNLGGCQCGQVRYEFSEMPLELYVCHCKECQKQSASAFGISVFVSRDSFSVTKGEPKFWSRPTDTGNTLECAFCPSCGSRLWHQSRGSAKIISIKGGSLDSPIDISEAIHIWTSRKLPGVCIPEAAAQFLEEPVDE